MPPANTLYYGDNLAVLREHVSSESVDLVYLDPPFNSNRNYNVLFARHDVAGQDQAQIQAFGDTWRWTAATEEQFSELVGGGLPLRVADTLAAFRTMLGENDAMAYLVNMTPRLVELHRVLKPTGSLWLHIDPTASHYLKLILDATFGPPQFRNEVIWRRTPFKGSSKSRAQQLPKSHDVLLFYSKSHTWTWRPPTIPYSAEYIAGFKWNDDDGRGQYRKTSLKTYSQATLERLRGDNRLIEPASAGAGYRYKQYLSESPGVVPIDDVWTDINMLNPTAKERLGYPTQKPVALMERILRASSNEGDVVLDPFCGCGTTVDAAVRLGRRWIGIDVTYLAVDLIEKRLRHTHGNNIADTYEIRGIPRDLGGAYALFSRSPFDFERWAVSLVNAQPNEKQVGDRGIDGVARFPLDGRQFGRVLVSVKGGKTVGPQFVRDLLGTLETEKAQMGVLITMAEPTRGVVEAVNRGGTYTHPANGQTYSRVQVVTVAELLRGKRPAMPPTVLPYMQAKRSSPSGTQPMFDVA